MSTRRELTIYIQEFSAVVMLKQEIIKAKIILHNSIFLAINNVIHVTYYWGSKFLISIKIDGFTIAQSKMNM